MTSAQQHADVLGLVEARAARPEFAGHTVAAQVDAALAWYEPLAADRSWRLRQHRRRTVRVGQVAPAVVATFRPPAGTRPVVRCPAACWATHRDDLQEVG